MTNTKKEKKVQDVTIDSLLKEIDKVKDVLASAGVDASSYIQQLSYLLFLKMDKERVEDLGFKSFLPEDCTWDKLLEYKGDGIVNEYNRILKELSEQNEGIVKTIFSKAMNSIHTPAHLNKVIELIGGRNWLGTDTDFNGDLYEKILEENGTDTKSNGGVYFTPRPLINAIIDCIQPKITETVHDPACGTGGFLLQAFSYMKQQSNEQELQDNLQINKISGNDNAPMIVTLASMNMYLHQIGIPKNKKNKKEEKYISPIKHEDSLATPSHGYYDVILANPPFGTRPSGSIGINRQDFCASTSNNEFNFLQHIMSCLNATGRAAVVFPDSILADSHNAEKEIRNKLIDEFNLHTILRLPRGLFYATIETNVLFFDAGSKTKKIWYYDYRTGIKHSLATNPLKRSDLDDFVKCYCAEDKNKRVETYNAVTNPNGRWRCFDIEDIKKSDKALDQSWIVLDDDISKVKLDDILKGMNDESDKIVKTLKSIQDFIGELR